MTGFRAPADGRDRRGFYWRHGQRYVSVTTALGVIEKPALRFYHREEALKRALDMADDLPSLLAQHGRRGVLGLLRASSDRRMEDAQTRGSAVHRAVHQLAMGAAVEITPQIDPYVRAWRRFCDDHKPEFIYAECETYRAIPAFFREFIDGRESWDIAGYAGTFDALAAIDGVPTFIDYKTGRGVYADVALQLAGYAAAELIVDPATRRELPMPTDAAGAAIHLTPDGYRLIPVAVGAAPASTFLDAVALWRYRERMERDWADYVEAAAMVSLRERSGTA